MATIRDKRNGNKAMRMPRVSIGTMKSLLLLSFLSGRSTTFAFVPPAAVLIAPSVIVSATNRNHRVWSAASTEDNTSKAAEEQEETIKHVNHVVCGAGPAGILSAIMLAQKFPNDDSNNMIHVYDRRPPPPSLQDDSVWDDVARFYTLGVFGRGKTALETFGVWKDVEEHSAKVVGNQVWREGKAIQSFFNESGRDPIYTLPRDKLVSILYQHVVDNYKDRIQMHFGQEVEPLDFAYSNNTVLVQIRNCKGVDGSDDDDPECSTDDVAVRMATNLLIGADGSARTVANQMEKAEKKERSAIHPLKRLLLRPFSVTRFVDDNQRVYKTIPLQLPSDWRHDLGYSTSAQKRRWSIVSLPANRKGTTQCAVWLMKKDDYFATAAIDPLEVRNMLEDNFPYLSDLLSDEDVTKIAQKPPSNFPFYRFAGPRLHKGDATVVLGDAAHTVKPYNGLGVNSAFEDVKILGDVLDRTDNNVAQAVREFSKERAADSKALVTLSRASDRPGWKVMFTFVIPIMLDAFFSKVAPKLFELPVPALVHNEKYRFHQVARRKRLDRIGQLSIVALAFTGVVKLSNVLIQRAATALGRNKSTVSLALSGAALCLLVAKKLIDQFSVRQTRS